jgi:hypothetical protein
MELSCIGKEVLSVFSSIKDSIGALASTPIFLEYSEFNEIVRVSCLLDAPLEAMEKYYKRSSSPNQV